VKEIEKEIEVIRGEKEGAIKAQDFEKAAGLRDKEKQTKEKLDAILAKWRQEREEKEVLVTGDDMMHIISKVTGVPLQRMEQKETEKQSKDRPCKTVNQVEQSGFLLGSSLKQNRSDAAYERIGGQRKYCAA
jgi:ATP-dependent Clp protease ATP-binding subunit ClpC